MRILLVASEAPPTRSGVARSVAMVAEGLELRGHQIHWLSAADAPGLRRGDLRLSSLAVWPGRLGPALAQVDVVNVHGPAPTLADLALLRLAARRARGKPVPVVYTHHFTVELGGRRLAPVFETYDRANCALARRSDAVIVTTDGYAEHYRKLSGGAVKPVVVPWGVDPPESALTRRPPTSALRVLVVGQFRTYKGIGIAIEALGGVPAVDLSILGSGPLESTIVAAAKPHGNITVVGALSDAERDDLYRAHDVILLPSLNRQEAFGLTLLEGMRSGAVPVASDLLGVRDVVGTSGLVVPAGNPDRLRHAIVSLANDPARWQRLSADAVRRASEFSWERTVRGYERVLLDVAA